MPGFSKPYEIPAVIAQDSTPTISVVADQTFYGFKINPVTGKLTVEKINDGSVVSLPVTGVKKQSDYKHWVWTERNLKFSWDTGSNVDRLKVEVR